MSKLPPIPKIGSLTITFTVDIPQGTLYFGFVLYGPDGTRLLAYAANQGNPITLPNLPYGAYSLSVEPHDAPIYADSFTVTISAPSNPYTLQLQAKQPDTKPPDRSWCTLQGGTWDETTGTCKDSNGKIITKGGGGGGGGGGGTTPPGGGGGPSSGCDSLKPDSTDINPIDWMPYIACIIQSSLSNFDLSKLGQQIIDALLSAIPQWFKDLLHSAQDLVTNINLFFTKPDEFYRKHALALWTPGSPTAVGTYLSSSQTETAAQAAKAATNSGPSFDVMKPINDSIDAFYQSLGATFEAPITTETAIASANSAALVAIGFEELASIMSLATEWIPGIDMTGLAFMLSTILQSTGVTGIVQNRILGAYQANVGRELDHAFNEKYQNVLPTLPDLERLINVNKISPEDWIKYAVRATGETGDWLNKVRLSKMIVPTLADAILWNRRHTDKQFDIAANGDLLGMNFTDYKDMLLERQWTDLGMRQFKIMYDLGSLPESDLDFAISRLGYRKDILPGQSKSDFQVVHDYITGQTELTLEKQQLAAKAALYKKGLATDAELRLVASKVYSQPDRLETYLSTEKDKQTLYNQSFHTIAVTTLEKMVSAGAVDLVHANAMIDTYKFDDYWKSAYKAYLASLVTPASSTAGT